MRAINGGFGVETDIRDLNGNLVISHDPPVDRMVFPLGQFLEAYCKSNRKPLLALNIKSDGLHVKLYKILKRFDLENYFVFDMSIPDTLNYIELKMSFAVRLSEYENGERLLESSETVWMDAFESQWYDVSRVCDLLNTGKRVCIVSPELHRLPHIALWDKLVGVPAELAQRLYLCTDLWDQAREVFNVVED